MSPVVHGGLPAHLVDFVGALRRSGIAVGPGESVDAAAVIAELDLLQREQLREGLAAAMLRRIAVIVWPAAASAAGRPSMRF